MAMRSYSGLALDDDILDRIMTFCPTFGTLQSTVLVSKSFYRIFQTHPKSITRAVAYNIVGPALPQALRVIQYPYPAHHAADTLDALRMATECPEDHAPSVITADEKAMLQGNSKVVAALEDIYSLTNKDRTSKTSVLTPEESWRFRRAMYRLMLYCNLFPPDRHERHEIDDLEDTAIEKIFAQRTAVLNVYPTDELVQLYAVAKFMRGLLEGLSGGDPRTVDIFQSLGPARALYGWQERHIGVLVDDISDELFDNDDDIALFSGYFATPFKNLWETRKIPPLKDEEPLSKWILDQVNGANDTCSQCASPGGLQLFTDANWHRFPIILPNLLKSNLKANPLVTQPFFAATRHIAGSDALGPWISGLWAFRQTEFHGWDVGDSYCSPCLLKFLEEHVWRWFLDHQLAAGWTPPEDCWYGWNCRTQTHSLHHQQTRNHLCVPTK
ncbi:hypothetical protein DFH07DRAFT_841194 [Mycena maculata]|uniref:Uncharacterized protein n=1 Tax=Mycena maculata TaxID=230809 RepID=A0AAD7IB40_9AGAR|nr:hypothetical protein DFH07DRAFT_841194 [Mycena maculata]